MRVSCYWYSLLRQQTTRSLSRCRSSFITGREEVCSFCIYACHIETPIIAARTSVRRGSVRGRGRKLTALETTLMRIPPMAVSIPARIITMTSGDGLRLIFISQKQYIQPLLLEKYFSGSRPGWRVLGASNRPLCFVQTTHGDGQGRGAQVAFTTHILP